MTLTANSDLAEAVGTVKQEASSVQQAHGVSRQRLRDHPPKGTNIDEKRI